ncbi:MAG: PKD domain-containing protein [Baekduia sp.]
MTTVVRPWGIVVSRRAAVFWVLAVLAGCALASGVAAPPTQQRAVGHARAVAASAPVRLDVSAAIGRAEPRYHARMRAGTLVMHNERHGLAAHFGAHGVRLDAATGGVTMRLTAAALDGAGYPLQRAAPRARANRVGYARGAVTEWYVNGPQGIEQGFDIAAPPAAARGRRLTVDLTVSGSRVRADDDGRGLTLLGGALNYRGLWAVDRSGRTLPARLVVHGRHVRLEVDVRGARFPVRVDPTFEAARLYASDGHPRDGLGQPVVIDGDTIVAGAPEADDQRGAVYVFTRPARGGWVDATEVARLIPAARTSGGFFGYALALDGDTLVVGEQYAPGGGRAHVFTRGAGTWQSASEAAVLRLDDTTSYAEFGKSVAIDGDTIAIGAPSSGSWAHGAVAVFVKPTGGWHDALPTAVLTAAAPLDGDRLGQSVALQGPTIVAGAPSDQNNNRVGTALVFERPAGGWRNLTQIAALKPLQSVNTYGFGWSVALNGTEVAVASPYLFQDSPNQLGAIFEYTRPAGGWANATETARLVPAALSPYSRIGWSVAFAGDTIVTGARYQSGASSLGRVYGFSRPASGWSSASDTWGLSVDHGSAADGLGGAVAYTPGTIVAGTDNGSVYVWEEDDTPPDSPVLTGVSPASPANANGPRVTGAAEPNATVQIFRSDGCAGTPEMTTTAAALATAAGIVVSVDDDSTTAISASATDRAGNVSACSNALTFTEDSTAPETTMTDGPAGPTDDPTPTFRFASEDVSARLECAIDGAAFTPCASPVTTTALSEGAHRFAVRAIDAAGNADPTPATSAFVVDTSAPNAALTASPSRPLTGQVVTLDASGSSDPPAGRIVHYVWDTDGDGLPDTDTGATPTVQHVFADVGDVRPSVRVTDDFGRTGTARVDVSVRAAPPRGRTGLVIDGGAAFTNDPKVRIDVVWPAGAQQMTLSNDGGFRKAVTFDVRSRLSWKLATSGSERSPRIVYARFDDDPAQTATDRILLDRTPPRLRAVRFTGRRILLHASDATSGLESVEVRNRHGKTVTVPYRAHVSVKSDPRTVTVRVVDGAGNPSSWRRPTRGRG